MISENIYALTRVTNSSKLQRMEKQMSRRQYFLKVKGWEIRGLRSLTDKIHERIRDISYLDFFYSFTIPKLGKEFDLLRLDDDTVINIELKSGDVSDEKIKKQLAQNRHYLALLGRNIRSYTYISNSERLVRLTNSGRLIESDFDSLCEDIKKMGKCYSDHLEKLFREEELLISPLTDPDKFLRREYFLTSQQSDIKFRIIKNIKDHKGCVQGFTGLPGTGKTLLLYDIAMELTEKQRVCVLHFGSYPEEMMMLNERLKRIDFYHCGRGLRLPDFALYSAVLVDEGHRIQRDTLDELIRNAKRKNIPVIFSYDKESAIAEEERLLSQIESIEEIEGFIQHRLTNRIRMNSELSAFIHDIMVSDISHRRSEYPSVSVSYTNDSVETAWLLSGLKKDEYIYIRKDSDDADVNDTGHEIGAGDATCREFEKVVMVINKDFYYDKEGRLRSTEESNRGGESPVRLLFHGLSRAKSKLAVIIMDNETVFETVLKIVTGE